MVSLPGSRRPPAWRVAVTFAGGSARVFRIEVAVPAAPLLWYVQHVEATVTPPATTLIAFSDARYPEGTVLSGEEALASGVTGEQQVAAFRWWTGSGLVHQIYVSPGHRRKGVAGKLAHAAYGLQGAQGGPPLHGDGRRTDDGEAWTRALPGYGAWRVAPRSAWLPSMTPATG